MNNFILLCRYLTYELNHTYCDYEQNVVFPQVFFLNIFLRQFVSTKLYNLTSFTFSNNDFFRSTIFTFDK